MDKRLQRLLDDFLLRVKNAPGFASEVESQLDVAKHEEELQPIYMAALLGSYFAMVEDAKRQAANNN